MKYTGHYTSPLGEITLAADDEGLTGSFLRAVRAVGPQAEAPRRFGSSSVSRCASAPRRFGSASAPRRREKKIANNSIRNENNG